MDNRHFTPIQATTPSGRDDTAHFCWKRCIPSIPSSTTSATAVSGQLAIFDTTKNWNIIAALVGVEKDCHGDATDAFGRCCRDFEDNPDARLLFTDQVPRGSFRPEKRRLLVQAISQLHYKSGQILAPLRASHTGTLFCPGNKRIISSRTRSEIWY